MVVSVNRENKRECECKMATIKDVAKCARVSIATVSKVINDVDDYIKDETRRRVVDAIEECGYVPNKVARGLKTRRTNLLGFVLPDIANPYYTEVAKGIESAARPKGYNIVFCNTNINMEDEIKSIELLKSQMVDGIIFGSRMLVTENVSATINLSFPSIPMVFIGRISQSLFKSKLGRVYVDEQKMVYDGVHILAAKGCESIAFVSSNETGHREGNVRLQGYLEAMRALGRDVVDRHVILGDYDLATGKSGVQQLAESGAAFDGIMCGNDLIAIGAIDTLRRLGYGIPADVRVMGLDNIDIAAFTWPRLSTMAQPTFEMGRAAGEMMIDNIENKKPLETLIFEHSYVERETV